MNWLARGTFASSLGAMQESLAPRLPNPPRHTPPGNLAVADRLDDERDLTLAAVEIGDGERDALVIGGWRISNRNVTSAKSSRATIPYPESLLVPSIVDTRAPGASNDLFRPTETLSVIYRSCGASNLMYLKWIAISLPASACSATARQARGQH